MRFLAVALFLPVFTWAEDVLPPKPNIIVMMVDDMGVGDTSVYLGKSMGTGMAPIERTLRTPNLDAFAEEAVVFTNAYAPASMCSSTRYSLLTGRSAHRAYLKKQGWLPHGPNTPMIQKGMPTLPGMLQANGYVTAGIGKYHVGMAFDDGYGQVATKYDFSDVDFTKPILDGPTHHGFTEFFGVTGNTEDSLDLEPRIYIRNDQWTFTDRSQMKRIGMKDREGRILTAPDWDLARLGEDYLDEVKGFLGRQAEGEAPFFLYYVPNANHLQRNVTGEYAVPEEVAGVKIKGESRYTDGEVAGDREDMILENDVVFGEMLKTLRETKDPRNGGAPLIDNTLIIFTSDNGPNTGINEETNQESGGLRSKKAKIWEGGIRVPLLMYWKGVVEGDRINENIFSLTDLYATLAQVAGHELQPDEAQDSHECLRYWTGAEEGKDERSRIFFCHLGPPFSNDVLAYRKGSEKLLVQGGLTMPWIDKGRMGASIPHAYYDLESNPLEEGEEVSAEHKERAEELAAELLEIHNRGYNRDLGLENRDALILDDGWHNLRNDVTGDVGFEFRVQEDRAVTHLGLWDDHTKDVPVRGARNVPTEFDRDAPTIGDDKKTGLEAPHTLRLIEVGSEVVVAELEIAEGGKGEVENEFRYFPMEEPVTLSSEKTYRLTMSTETRDGDQFHDPASFDGLSPLVHPHVEILRAVGVPAFADVSEDYFTHRLPVGPTLRFGE